MRRFYAQFVQSGDLAFDVGANTGSRTHVFLQLGARVVAVEPQKECARVLFTRYYSRPGFHVVNKALGAADGRAEMLIHESNLGSSLSQPMIDALVGSRCESHFQPGRWKDRRTVGVTTFDALVAEYGLPAFAKIDVDGYEYEVVRGLSQPPRALSLEFVPAYLESALQSIEHLRRFGAMRMNYAIEERFEWMLDRWVTADEMVAILGKYRDCTEFVYGDVYVRFGEE